MSGKRVRKCLGYGKFWGKCENPAGCPHSPHWCVRCNKIRMDSITAKLEAAVRP